MYKYDLLRTGFCKKQVQLFNLKAIESMKDGGMCYVLRLQISFLILELTV
jgi:hypothetical protein